ncbi:hypothetical protein B0T19DRAFT_395629 [Cercophora scortea]|uniref:Uncharacterized protein n=1 Tax=Cercophora scortea TaxID=314031 RepID=A0AAE0J375_9PEZI|nr:hypothetical protein B0T19DRAFT_395629 [Cercophora scortea]
MQLTAFANSLVVLTLAIGTNAVSFRSEGFARVSRQDPHIGDIRTWGQLGCSADNQGVWTITTSELDLCHDFGITVKAVNLTDINDGCSFFAFSEAGCKGVRCAFGTGSGCGDAVDGVDSWGSFEFTCSTGA